MSTSSRLPLADGGCSTCSQTHWLTPTRLSAELLAVSAYIPPPGFIYVCYEMSGIEVWAVHRPAWYAFATKCPALRKGVLEKGGEERRGGNA